MENNSSRRNFLKVAGSTLLLAPVATSLASVTSSYEPRNKKLNPDLEKGALKFNILEFGAKGDGQTKDTVAIQQAIDRCWVLGGGEVIVPAGNFLTGAIALKSNTILRLEKDAVLLGSPDFADYPVTQVRWEGKWIQGHIGLIYAIDAENIGIVGQGKIAGNHELGGRPSAENPLRHPALIEPIGCTNIRFEDFSTDYHRMWCLHPTYCENISIKNLYIRSTGGNGDGIDIDSCKHVTIDGCDIFTGDDCIAIKSGRGAEGYALLRTTEDVYISNCTFGDSIFACIGIGSETSGGIRNVRIEHCKFTYAKTYAVYIKSRPGRGAFIEDIYVNDIDVSGVEGGCFRFNLMGSGIKDPAPVPGLEGIPTLKNFQFTNIRVTDVPVLFDGTSIHPDKPLNGFLLKNVTGTCSKGITLANIKNAKINNIAVTGYTGDLLGVYNVKGNGSEQAVPIDPPTITEARTENDPPYKLH